MKVPEAVRSIFTLDLRSLALFRIAISLIVIRNLWSRFDSIEYFLSDDGFFSRADYLETLNRPWNLSIHMMFGEVPQVQLLFLLHGLLALGMLIGWHTRACTFAVWLLTISLNHRNPLVINGGDTFLALSLFWSLFLPLNARWSIDRLNNCQDPGESNEWSGVGAITLISQILIMYLATAALKSTPAWWGGQAIQQALSLDRLAKPFGTWLLNFPSLNSFLTYATILWEWIGPLLILIPFGKGTLRIIAVTGFTALHFAMYLTMELALFPWVCIAVWLAILPGRFWRMLPRTTLLSRISRKDRFSVQGASRVNLKFSCFSNAVAICALIFIALWNLRPVLPEALEDSIEAYGSIPGSSMRLMQRWSMFATPPDSDGWWVLEGTQGNGSQIDLFRGGAPLDSNRPECLSCQWPDRRWTKYLDNLGKRRYRTLRGDFCNLYIERWNQTHDVGLQIASARFVYYKEHYEREFSQAPERRILWKRSSIDPSL